jgi:uncharacterized glyoxalase superfamily protein PhnB
MNTKQKITPCLWFNFNAEEAVNHYLSIFKSGKVLEVSRYGDAMRYFFERGLRRPSRGRRLMGATR